MLTINDIHPYKGINHHLVLFKIRFKVDLGLFIQECRLSQVEFVGFSNELPMSLRHDVTECMVGCPQATLSTCTMVILHASSVKLELVTHMQFPTKTVLKFQRAK